LLMVIMVINFLSNVEEGNFAIISVFFASKISSISMLWYVIQDINGILDHFKSGMVNGFSLRGNNMTFLVVLSTTTIFEKWQTTDFQIFLSSLFWLIFLHHTYLGKNWYWPNPSSICLCGMLVITLDQGSIYFSYDLYHLGILEKIWSPSGFYFSLMDISGLFLYTSSIEVFLFFFQNLFDKIWMNSFQCVQGNLMPLLYLDLGFEHFSPL
ncbi:hypothetical protein ACJX0J_027641, partial [Zea mays]